MSSSLQAARKRASFSLAGGTPSESSADTAASSSLRTDSCSHGNRQEGGGGGSVSIPQVLFSTTDYALTYYNKLEAWAYMI